MGAMRFVPASCQMAGLLDRARQRIGQKFFRPLKRTNKETGRA